MGDHKGLAGECGLHNAGIPLSKEFRHTITPRNPCVKTGTQLAVMVHCRMISVALKSAAYIAVCSPGS